MTANRPNRPIYLDYQATTPCDPRVVDRMMPYFSDIFGNPHSADHRHGWEADAAVETARGQVAALIGAKPRDIIFTSGATESNNLAIKGAARHRRQADGRDTVITLASEHKCVLESTARLSREGFNVKILPIQKNGLLDLSTLKEALDDRVAIVSVMAANNEIGVIQPLADIGAMVRECGAWFHTDAAQAFGKYPLDVDAICIDMMSISGHKIYGPTGIGVLYGKEERLNDLDPYQFGGEMILKVTFDETTYNGLPHKFEAGTPNIAGAIGMGASIDFINDLDMNLYTNHEMELHDYTLEKLKNINGIKIIGKSNNKSSIISFIIDGIHPHDIGTIINQKGIAVRTGHHCTMPLMDFYNIPGTVRASFSFYNTFSEVDRLIDAINLSIKMLK